jgi:hypothetical protein
MNGNQKKEKCSQQRVHTSPYSPRDQQVLKQLLQQLLLTIPAFREDYAHHMYHGDSVFHSKKAVKKCVQNYQSSFPWFLPHLLF